MQLPEPPGAGRRPLLYFCDESHIRTSEWMGIGGLAVSPTRATEIGKQMDAIRSAHGVPPHSEVKWTKAKSKSAICRAYIGLLFDLVEDGYVHFHVRFSPFGMYDHNASGDRKQTDTVSKAYYQLLLHRAGKFYGESCKVLVRPDNGECTAYLPKIVQGLNADISLRYKLRHDAITDIAPRDSRTEHMLQLLDVSLGALTAARNGGIDNGKLSTIKSDLARYTLERCGSPRIEMSHSSETRRFNIWNTTPKWRKGAVPTR